MSNSSLPYSTLSSVRQSVTSARCISSHTMRFSCAVKSVKPSMYMLPSRAKSLYGRRSASSVSRSALSVRSLPTAAEKAAMMSARSRSFSPSAPPVCAAASSRASGVISAALSSSMADSSFSCSSGERRARA